MMINKREGILLLAVTLLSSPAPLFAQDAISTLCGKGTKLEVVSTKLASAVPERVAIPQGALFDTQQVTLKVRKGDRFFLSGSAYNGTPLKVHGTDDKLVLSTTPGAKSLEIFYPGTCGGTSLTKQSPYAIDQIFALPQDSAQPSITVTANFSDVCGTKMSHTDYFILQARCIPECSDGIDNDGDGAIDLKDFSCKGDPNGIDESLGKSQCQDGIDNDNDGAVDLADFSCGGDNQKDDEKFPLSQCQNGKDDDGDGFIDDKDYACGAYPHNQNKINSQRNDESTPLAQCQDKTDNDGDGLTDSQDPGCWYPETGYHPYLEPESRGTAQCQDRSDNDGDGSVDLADPGCADAADNDESNEPPAAVKVNLDCVFDNQDGTFSAYFGYENTTGAALEFVSDAAAKPETRNEVSPNPLQVTVMPSLISGGLVTRFTPGLVKGALKVTFDGKPTTWTVRAPGTGISKATASSTSPACLNATAKAECSYLDPVKGLMVRFGYTNPNQFDLATSVGAMNSFSPNPADRNQPVLIKAGLNNAAFMVPFVAGLKWSLHGFSAQPTAATPLCSGACDQQSTANIKRELDKAALQLAALVNKAAGDIEQAAKKKLSSGTISKAEAQKYLKSAERAKKKSADYSAQAKRITLGIPDVITTCPAKPYCESVDNLNTFNALNGIYTQMYKAGLARFNNRSNFILLSKTNRLSSLLAEGRATRSAGQANIQKLPRYSTKCR